MCDPWCSEVCRLHLSHVFFAGFQDLEERALERRLDDYVRRVGSASAGPRFPDRRHDRWSTSRAETVKSDSHAQIEESSTWRSQ